MFNVKWEFEYLVAENSFNEVQCMVCYRTIGSMKKYNIKRHYDACHNEYFVYTGEERRKLITELKKNFAEKMSQISANNKSCSMLKAKQKASYVISLALAKHCRPFEDGIFLKDVSKLVLECFGEKGKEFIDIFDGIPLARQTIARRTENINMYIYSQIKTRIAQCKYFSICLDESTDISDVSQLLICVKTVDTNFTTCEEVLSVISMHGNVTGKTIYEAVQENVFSFADKGKLSAVCTDGAAVMRGKKEGLIGLLKKDNINVPAFHCVIHQQALLSKSVNMSEAMKIAVQIINRIRGGHNALTHRKFVSFLEEVEANYGDLLLHTEVRWLSRGKCLERLFDLRSEVIAFLEKDTSKEMQNLALPLKDPDFLLDLAFLCDITHYLNEFNLLLQGKDKEIFHLVSVVDAFQRKITLLEQQFKEKNLTYLPKTADICNQFSNHEKLSRYIEIFELLNKNFADRFNDFSEIRNLGELYETPLICNIDSQSHNLQNELRKMQSDLSLPLETGINFWKMVDDSVYPNIKDAIYKLFSMFGTTYLCESAFSTLNLIKSKQRNRLSDKHMEALMRIKHYQFDIDLENLMETFSQTEDN